jgi:hypothetical protein
MDIDYSEHNATELFNLLVKNNTFVCPTLVVWNAISFLDEKDLANDARLKFMPSYTLDYWNRISNEFRNEGLLDGLKIYCQKGIDLVGKMRDAGVELLSGTDSGMHFCFPGFSLHDELALFVRAGLSPSEALRTATYNPAKFFGKLNSMGTIEQGKVADLVLLEANPLKDIKNTKKIAAVVIDGKVFQKAELQKMLAEVETLAWKSKKN